jgi:hypothetical protein
MVCWKETWIILSGAVQIFLLDIISTKTPTKHFIAENIAKSFEAERNYSIYVHYKADRDVQATVLTQKFGSGRNFLALFPLST